MHSRLVRSAWLWLPVLFLFAAYWRIFHVWFRADDFAWLGLKLSIDGPRKFWLSLFEPQAQGTVRVLSERVPFLLFSTLFGYETAPFRILSLATQAANCVLLSLVCLRITGSRLAAGLAPVVWCLNAGVAATLCWFATYNQLLEAFCLLAALLAFIDRRMKLCWAAYLTGFLVLELNVVVPAVLAWYSLLFDRPRLRQTLPMFVPAGLFAALHLFVIPKAPDPHYKLYYDLDILNTLYTYFLWALGPKRWAMLVPEDGLRWHRFGTPLLIAACVAFLAWELRRKSPRGAFFLGCFVIILGPLLPLKAHVIEYYLGCASFGLAAFLAWLVAESWQQKRLVGAVAALVIAISLWSSWNVRKITFAWYLTLTNQAESLVRHVVEARRLHPKQSIALINVDALLFWNGFSDDPFRLWGVKDVWLAPTDNGELDRNPDAVPWILPAANVLWQAERDAVAVYEFRGDRLKNLTTPYLHKLLEQPSPALPRWADLGKPLYAELLGEGWHELVTENSTRWMGARSVVTLGGGAPPGARLYLHAYAPANLFEKGPVELRVKCNGQALEPVALPPGGVPFELYLPLPAAVLGDAEYRLELEPSRAVADPRRPRQLSLVFGRVAIR